MHAREVPAADASAVALPVPDGPTEAFEATVVQAMKLPIIDPRAAHGETSALPSDDTLINDLPTLGYIGRYALKHQLGQGGLGTVYAALDPLLGRAIALKTLRLDGPSNTNVGQRAAFESMLLAEARAAAGLNHPNIVTVYDAGLNEHGVYIAMEKLKGEDLKQRLADGWRPDAMQAAHVVARVADALDYAHRMGVVHCDIKPANIFMTGNLQPKVVDFGIAKVAHAVGVDVPLQLAQPDALSPYYAAPEQIEGDTVDARSDVYALGVVLYELLTGQRPYRGASIDELKAAVLRGDAPTVNAIHPRVPMGLSAVAARAMARAPEQRYRSAHLLARALQRCVNEGAQAGAQSQRRKLVMLGSACTAALMGGVVWLGLGSPRWDTATQASKATRTATIAVADVGESTPKLLANAGVASSAAGTAFMGARSPFVLTPMTASATAGADASASINDATKGKAMVAAATKPSASKPSVKASSVLGSLDVAAAASSGVVQIAVAPWGQVEVNGKAAGVTPPLTSLTLPVGTHQIVIRNADFPPHTATVVVDAQRGAIVKHRFGS